MKISKMWLIPMFILTLAACSGGGGSKGSSVTDIKKPPPDTSTGDKDRDTDKDEDKDKDDGDEELPDAAKIISTSPAKDSADVVLDTAISATFSADMNASTLNNTTFYISSENGNIDGDISYRDKVATFTPSNGLDLLTRYTATVKKDVKDAKGIGMKEVYSWSFTTREGAWGLPEYIAENAGSYSYPQIAVDPDGNMIAVWKNSPDGINRAVHTKRYDANSKTWEPVNVFSSSGNTYSSPKISMDKDGNAMVVWSEASALVSKVYSNYFDSATKAWNGVEEVSTGGVNPEVAFGPSGDAIAVWQQADLPTRGISTSRHAKGGTWGDKVRLDDSSMNNAQEPKITIDKNGNVFAVWSQIKVASGPMGIFVNRYDAKSSTWGLPAELGSFTIAFAYSTGDIVIDSDGNAVVVWQQKRDSNYDINSRKYDAVSKNWDSVVKISGPDGSYRLSGIDINSAGDVFAFLMKSDLPPLAYVNYFDGTAKRWGTAEVFGDPYVVQEPKIVFDQNNNAIVVWKQFNGTLFDFYAGRYNYNEDAWGSGQLISDMALGIDSSHPGLAVGPQGKIVVIFVTKTGTKITVNEFK